jgi:hypothetical protein
VTVSVGGQSCIGTLNHGAGSCTITLSSVGTNILTATYSGDGNFNGSSATAAHEVSYEVYVPVVTS